MVITRALDLSTGGLERLAEETGISYNTLWSWRQGRRNPSPENLVKLAVALRHRSGELAALADSLEQAAVETE